MGDVMRDCCIGACGCCCIGVCGCRDAAYMLAFRLPGCSDLVETFL
jgi:hypothetical protein